MMPTIRAIIETIAAIALSYVTVVKGVQALVAFSRKAKNFVTKEELESILKDSINSAMVERGYITEKQAKELLSERFELLAANFEKVNASIEDLKDIQSKLLDWSRK